MSALVPARTALLLMDFQNGIVAMLGDKAPALLERAGRARAAARQAGIAVMYVRVAFTAADAAAVPAHNPMLAAAAASGRLADGGEATSIHPALAPAPGEEVFRKCRVGAFSTTDLGARLSARGIDTLVLSGISTSGVVLSTLRDAADHDYRLFVIADCCGDTDAEVHRVLTEKVFPRQAQVIGLDGFGAMAAG
ncbi:MAG: cysteine hydrolase [Alphaproteobacteria bacterium]|nr:cysteine hydrolase [Alphaproteobacteria bacterium]MDE2073541.1 cysteine hydrolase [Alphaproteobacteria bacterium]